MQMATVQQISETQKPSTYDRYAASAVPFKDCVTPALSMRAFSKYLRKAPVTIYNRLCQQLNSMFDCVHVPQKEVMKQMADAAVLTLVSRAI